MLLAPARASAALLFLSLVSLVSPVSLAAPARADEWTIVAMDPSVTVQDLVMLPDGQNGFAVGATAAGGLVLSAVLRTTDGGASWSALDFADAAITALSGVSFVSPSAGWVVGTNGRIYATTDAGLTWTAQASGTGRRLSKVHFLDAARGWVTGGWQDGASYLVLRTTNGGASWQNMSFGTTAYSCEDIFFADPLNGWLCGYDSTINGQIHHTTDGGASWVRQTVPGTPGAVYALDFPNASEGWASTASIYASPSGAVLHTTNGGTTWTVSTYTNLHYNYAIDADGPLRVAVAAVQILSPAGERVHLTTNGGATWMSPSPPIINYTYAVQVTGPSIRLGADFGQILRSTDDGASWDWEYRAPLWNSLAWPDAMHGWVVAGSNAGTDGYCYRTTDGGARWFRDRGAPGGARVQFLDATTGWMLWEGNTAAVWRTTNGGGTWARAFIGTGSWIEDIHFATALSGWAVGGNGTIRRTTDGGATWQPQTSGTADFVQDVYFIDANEGWAAGGFGGGNGFIRHTTDGGVNWTPQTPAVPDHVQSISFVDSERGWLAAVGGGVQRTTNGGAVWQYVGQVSHTYIDRILMTDGENGWLAARNPYSSAPGEDGRGFIYRTTNGGATWALEFQAPWVKGAVSDLAAASDGVLWAAGAHNMLLSRGGSAAVESPPPAPVVLALDVAPNPFQSETALSYFVPAPGHVSLVIYDLSGRRVRTLAAAAMPSGRHTIAWNGHDERGRETPAGVYFARLSTGGRDAHMRLCRTW